MKSLPLKPHPALSRLMTCLLLGTLLAGLNGCAFFRPVPPLTLPAGFQARTEAAALRDPHSRAAAYKKLFPELTSIQASGTLNASSRWRRGKEYFEFTYFSLNDRVKTEHMLRLRARRALVPFFDIIVRGRIATAVIYPEHVIFRGEIPPEGSPFVSRFGLEPWDLVPIFTVGQRVAGGDFKTNVGKRDTTLYPRDKKTGGGLRRVALENQSGLPRTAIWEINGKTYEVRYLGWDYFTDNLTEETTRLMPTAIEIRRYGVVIALKMGAYQYDKKPSDQMFSVSDVQGFTLLPLDQLKKIL